MIVARIVMLLLFCAMAGAMLGQWPGPGRLSALSQALGLGAEPRQAARPVPSDHAAGLDGGGLGNAGSPVVRG